MEVSDLLYRSVLLLHTFISSPQTYELHLEGGRVPQTFIQHVVPGSAAFVAGLFPGDCILEVNRQDMHHCHANEVVAAIQKTKGDRLVRVKGVTVRGVTVGG